MNLDMERQIHEIAAVCDYVQGLQQSPKRLWLSFDEWNVWYRARDGQATDGQRQFAPQAARRGLQPRGRAARRRLRQHAAAQRPIASASRCLAQIVNVIAPLVTNEKRRPASEHLLPVRVGAASYARGRVLDLRVESETYPITAAGLQADFARNDEVPFVDVVATLDAPNGQAAVLMLNRDLDGERELVLEWRRRDADARAGLRDAHRRRPEGVQHVRAAAARRAAARSTRPRAGHRA